MILIVCLMILIACLMILIVSLNILRARVNETVISIRLMHSFSSTAWAKKRYYLESFSKGFMINNYI